MSISPVESQPTELFPTPPPSLYWNSMVNGFVDRAVIFAHRHRGPRDIQLAWQAYRVWNGSWLDQNAEDWRLFLAWYVFHWRATENEDTDISQLVSCSLAEEFARECPEEVDKSEHKMIGVAIQSPLDFYEIHDLPELHCLYVKSLFLGYQHSYAFQELPKGLAAGDVFLGIIVHFESDKGVLIGHSCAFSNAAKVSIAYLKKNLIGKRKGEFLNNFSLFESDLFNLYHDLLSGKSS